MRHKFPNVSDYWKMKPKEQRASISSYVDDFPNKVIRSAHNYEWFGLFGLTAKESLIEYGIAARCIDLEKYEFECYAPDPDEDDCSIYFITTEDYIEERLRKHRELSTFLIQNNLSMKQFRLMEITEMIYVTALHFDLIDLLGLDIDETFIRTELSLDDNEKEEKNIVVEESASQKQIRDLSNLDFPEALRCIIDHEGDEIIKEVRLVNILSDYKSFDSIPASKFILKSFITEGYSKRLYAIGEWGPKCDSLSNQFAQSTGFQSDCVTLIFKSIAYGLRWLNEIPDMTSQLPKQPLIPSLNTSSDLNSITTVDPISTKDFTLMISNIFIEATGKKTLHVSFEANKKDKDKWCNLFVVLYDQSNRIRKKEKVYFMMNHRFVVVDSSISLSFKVSELSRIMIIAE